MLQDAPELEAKALFEHLPYVETRFGLIVDGTGTKGRYVRLYSNGNSSNKMNHYIEVEVFGISD